MFCTVNQLSNWCLHNNNIPSKWIKVSTRKTDFKKIANNTLKANSERVGNWSVSARFPLEVKRIFVNFKNEAMFKCRTSIDAVKPF